MATTIEILLGAVVLSILLRVMLQLRRQRQEDRFFRACGIHVLRSNDPMSTRLAALLGYKGRFRKRGLRDLQAPLESRSEGGLFAIRTSNGGKGNDE